MPSKTPQQLKMTGAVVKVTGAVVKKTGAAIIATLAITGLMIVLRPMPPDVPGRSNDLAPMVLADLKAIRSGTPVARPKGEIVGLDLRCISPAARRKELFIRILLPIILVENQRILNLREKIMARPAGPFEAITARYGATIDDRAELLRRVDIIPASLALAQGGLESGWGTSRFARLGNALFGQRTFNPEKPGQNKQDMVPLRSDGKFKVARFDTVADSVRAYIHNLNTHPAYSRLRLAREKSRQKNQTIGGQTIGGIALAGHLKSYSEKPQHYVWLLLAVIADNRLDQFDKARLE